mmetsp:Transcript_15227/g.22396  ORF Transcript_15227/g.22396 Transcript_15227/m.22396 type:complete len:236 (-) Transcript_15227:502-1209(-)
MALTRARTTMKITVHYYNFAFWRAEVLRAGLYLQNIPFEDNRNKESLPEIVKRSPFKALPVLEVDGSLISQTQAIASFTGKLGSVFDYKAAGVEPDASYPRLYPADDDYLGQARCDEIINGCTDVTTTVASTFRTPKEEVEARRTELIDPESGRLYMHLNGLNSLLCKDDENVACGCSMTVADICVWRLVGWLSAGVLDYIPADLISSHFPNLHKVHTNVQENDKMIQYMKEYHK